MRASAKPSVKAVPIIDFRYLGSPAKLNLNWDDPWYSRFDNPNIKRHHKSALMSYLYVEPHEVRHEVLIRVKDLDATLAFYTDFIGLREVRRKPIGDEATPVTSAPPSASARRRWARASPSRCSWARGSSAPTREIGRASCRERV